MNRKKLNRRSTAGKVLALFLIVSLCCSTFFMVSTSLFYHFFFTREDRSAACPELTYEDMDPAQLPRQLIQFPSGPEMLSGSLYGTGRRGVIVFAHGFASGADNHLTEALYFVQHGWRVLSFDGTGCRSSSGRSQRCLSQMSLDLLAALRYLASSELSDCPVLLYGHSCGAYAAAMALSSDYPIYGAVCLAPFNSPTELMCYQASRFVGRIAYTQYPYLWLQNQVLVGSEGNRTVTSALSQTSVPVLVVSGSNDAIVPAAISPASHQDEIANPLVSFLQIDDPYRGTHSALWLTSDAARYRSEVLDALRLRQDEAGRELTDDEAEAFLASVDRTRMFETDEAFMELIHEFFLQAVRSAS